MATVSIWLLSDEVKTFPDTDLDVLVTIEIWDKDFLVNDDFLGTVELPLKDLFKKGNHSVLKKFEKLCATFF